MDVSGWCIRVSTIAVSFPSSISTPLPLIRLNISACSSLPQNGGGDIHWLSSLFISETRSIMDQVLFVLLHLRRMEVDQVTDPKTTHFFLGLLRDRAREPSRISSIAPSSELFLGLWKPAFIFLPTSTLLPWIDMSGQKVLYCFS